jgi:hypothetical protein
MTNIWKRDGHQRPASGRLKALGLVLFLFAAFLTLTPGAEAALIDIGGGGGGLISNTHTLPDGTVGFQYESGNWSSNSFGIESTAITGVHSLEGVPPGLTITTSPATSMHEDWPIQITGTPTTAGAYTVTLTYDAYNGVQTAYMKITVYPASAPTVTTTSLPEATFGTSYSTTLSASGRPDSFTWKVTGLPPGLTLSGAKISGTPTKAGTCTVSATATNQVGSGPAKSFNLIVNSKPASALTISPIPDQIYSRNHVQPVPTIKDGDTVLKQGTDFTVLYSITSTQGQYSGTGVADVGFVNNYTGSVSLNFNIKPKDASAFPIAAIPDQTYTGSTIAPNISVQDTSEKYTLVAGTDYTVVWSGNTAPGTASGAVTFKGNYTGSSAAQFKIIPAPENGASIAAIDDQTYTRSAITPAVTVSDGKKTFTPNTDYTVSYDKNVDAGHAAVAVNFRGNYSGTVKGGFVIKPKDISPASVTAIAAQTYTGDPLAPALTVKDETGTLIPGTDYTATYSKNVDAGTADVSITGIGNYTGGKTASFAINAKNAASVVIDAIPDYTYTGAAITPGVSAKDGTRTLTPNTDYTLSYSGNVNAGTATVTVNFRGNYTGAAKTVNFKIGPLSENGATIAAINDQTYTGGSLTPAVTVSSGTKTFTLDTDYTVSYDKNVNTGHAAVTVTFKGNYSGTVSSGFVINPRDVSGTAAIDVIPDHTWTGSPIMPGLSVRDGNRTLASGTDYAVTYSDNIVPGKATATATFRGNYTGSKTVNFTIVPVAENGASIAAIPDQIYSGAAITPAVTVTDGTKTFTPNTDYTVSYDKNVDAGHASVTVTFRGGYAGTASSGFVIKPKDIGPASIDAISDQTYDGSALTPGLTVKDGTKTLTPNTDYTVSYSKNVDAGTASVTVTGLGNYTGGKNTSFAIKAKSAAGLTIDAIPDVTYTGAGIEPGLTIRDGTKVLIPNTDYTVRYSNNAAPGANIATATATFKGNYTGEKSMTFTILPKSENGASIAAIPDQTYTGVEIIPALTVSDGKKTFAANRDYTASYSDNVSAGHATVTVTFQGGYAGRISSGFVIKPEGADIIAIDGIPDHTWTGDPITPGLSVRDVSRILTPVTDYTASYSNNVEPGMATVTVELKGNYAGTKTATFNITPVSESGASIAAIPDQTWTGSPIIPAVTVSDGTKTFTPNRDYTVSYSNNIEPGTATVTVAFRGDYTGTATAGFVIAPRDFSSFVTVDVIPEQFYGGNSVTPEVTVKDGGKTLAEGTDYTVVYSNNDGPGTGAVTITGIGNYRGEKTENFTIRNPYSTDAKLTSVAGVAVTTTAQGTTDSPEAVSVSVASAKPSITTADVVPAPDASFHIYSDAGFSQNRDTAVTLPVGGSSHVYVKVTAQDGTTTGYYDVTASRPNSDAGLTSVAGMEVSTAGSGASISSPQTAAVIVDRNKSSMAASEVVCAVGADVKLYTDKNFAAPVSSVALDPGDYTHVYVKSTAQDGSLTLYYDVIVNRPNNDAGLLSLVGQSVTPGGESGTYGTPKTAAVTVASGQETITLSDIGGARDAAVHIYSDAACTQNEDQPVSLTPGGATHVYVKVTSEDGTSTLYYDVTVNRNRILSSDAGLTSIAGTPVTPGSQAGTDAEPRIVAVTTPEDKSSLSLADIGSASGSAVHIYSDSGFSQNQDAAVDLTSGEETHVYVKVTSEDGNTSCYYDVVAKRPRHLSSDAGLTSIAGQQIPTGTGGGALDSPTAVTVGTGSGQSSIGLPDVAGAPAAVVHIYSDRGFSQNEDQPVSLPAGGSAHLYIKVTAEDGTTKYYDVTANRAKEPSHSAELTAVAGVSVTPGVEAGTADAPLTASLVVPAGQATIALSDLLFSSGATAHIYSDVSFLHDQDAPLALPGNSGSVHLFVTIIAEDGTTALHYDVTVARAKALSSDASLISVAGHSVSGSASGGGSPSSPVSIAVNASSGTAAVTALDVVAAAGARVHIYPSRDYTHNEDGAVNLPEGGSAHLYVKVTAADNVTSKYYDVMVSRARTAGSDAKLSTLAGQPVIDEGGLGTSDSPDLATVTVPGDQTSIGPSDVGSASGSVAHICSDGRFSQNQDQPIALNPGENYVYISVTAEDGSTKYYNVRVTQENPPAPEPAPKPDPAPEPVPASDASGSTLSSTNITYGGVSIDGGLSWQNLERQADGTWLVVVPWETDLTRLALTFRLPNPATRLVPVNGTPEDFSENRAVAYTVTSADGSDTATYRVRAVRRPFDVVDDVLVDPSGALWKLAAVWNGYGWSFVVQAPVASAETSVTASHLPSWLCVSLDEWYYSLMELGLLDSNGDALSEFRSGRPQVLEIAGIAADMEALEGLRVEEIDWGFADEPGKFHRQYLNPPVTFDSIGDKTLVGPGGGSQRHGGGGCDGGLFSGALALALIPLFMSGRKRKQ